MDPAAKLEQVVRLQAVLLAHERGDREAVCEEGEAYLALPDVHLDLVTARPNIHAVVARAYDALEWPAIACDHYRWALLGVAHVHLADPVDLRLASAVTSLKTGRYEGLDDLLAELAELPDATASQRSTALRLAAVRTWRSTGDLDAADEALGRAATVADPAGTSWWHPGAYRGQFLVDADRVEEAGEVLDEAVAALRTRAGSAGGGAGLDLALVLALAALATARAGDPDRAQALLDEAAPLVPTQRTYALVHHMLVEAEVLAALDAHAGVEPERSDQTWAAALELADERDLRPTVVHAWEVRARTASDVEERRRALARARELGEALGHVADARRLDGLAGPPR